MFYITEKVKFHKNTSEQYELSFNAHLNLATIHPWVDGNERTARLLMNYIQFYYRLFELNQPFLDFMVVQLKKSLTLEIEKYNAAHKEGLKFMF